MPSIRPLSVVALALGFALLASSAGAENISTKSLLVKDNVNPLKRMVTFQSKDLGVAYTDADAPVSKGAWVHVYSDTDDHCSYLAPGAEWTTKNSMWKYKNSTTKNQAQLRDGRLIVKIRSGVTFSLADDLSQDAVHVQVQFGDNGSRYCMTCSAPLKDDEKQFRAKDCAAAACDEEPSSCGPAVCGDLEVGLGEDCEIDGDCTGGQVCSNGCLCVDVDGCGDGEIDAGEDCEVDGDCSGGETCTDRCFCVDPQCPGSIEITQHAGIGESMTSTDFDLGYTGFFHNADRSDTVRLALAVSEATESSPASCGEVTVGGVDPRAGNCRCQSDNRQTCDQPFENDNNDCGGGPCRCYLAPPEPVGVFGTPLCTVRTLTDDVTGTWNVDTGEGSLVLSQRLRFYAGISVESPCPVCVGDTAANDGDRDGECVGGSNDGLSCDANGADAGFPPSGSGAYSYDCLPGNVEIGSGLVFKEPLTTGNTSLAAGLTCGMGSETCPCGTCTLDSTVGCHNNADCTAVAAGNCQAEATRYPNECNDLTCTDIGGGEGVCDNGPYDTFCDGITKANGEGLFACNADFLCEADFLGIDAGTCNLVQPRSCFLDPIDATGSAHTASPLLASATCAPPSLTSVINTVVGLPGPVRQRLAISTTFPCAGAPASDYPSCP
jgi:hypothetical protein